LGFGKVNQLLLKVNNFPVAMVMHNKGEKSTRITSRNHSSSTTSKPAQKEKSVFTGKSSVEDAKEDTTCPGLLPQAATSAAPH